MAGLLVLSHMHTPPAVDFTMPKENHHHHSHRHSTLSTTVQKHSRTSDYYVLSPLSVHASQESDCSHAQAPFLFLSHIAKREELSPLAFTFFFSRRNRVCFNPYLGFGVDFSHAQCSALLLLMQQAGSRSVTITHDFPVESHLTLRDCV